MINHEDHFKMMKIDYAERHEDAEKANLKKSFTRSQDAVASYEEELRMTEKAQLRNGSKSGRKVFMWKLKESTVKNT
ncbi:hypothetical protein J6590_013862 [Homalodisca vitripennis]|nr:hypothetical protein J6590_013862 [Homalodisca vitripennis]